MPLRYLALASLLFMLPAAQADELNIHSVSEAPPNTPEGVLRPQRGLSTQQVEEQFGPPREKLAPVGDPPITRWSYDKFTVYFEHQYVIHSVPAR